METMLEAIQRTHPKAAQLMWLEPNTNNKQLWVHTGGAVALRHTFILELAEVIRQGEQSFRVGVFDDTAFVSQITTGPSLITDNSTFTGSRMNARPSLITTEQQAKVVFEAYQRDLERAKQYAEKQRQGAAEVLRDVKENTALMELLDKS